MTELKTEYDLCVLGCGPGGFAGAMRAFDFGQHVCIVEGGEIGGAGVKFGALSSKTLWELSKDYDVASRTNRGYQVTGLSVDFQQVMTTVEEAVKERQYQMLSQLETFSPRRWKGAGSITFIRGLASFLDRNSVSVTTADGLETICAKNFLIATGSSPRGYPGIETDQVRIIDSDGVLTLKKFPKRLLIVGAGIVGCEYATIFSNFEQTQVHLVDNKAAILPYEDADVSHFVQQRLDQAGVKSHRSATLQNIVKKPDCLEVVLDLADGSCKLLEVDVALISVGRVPNLETLNLSRIGIEVTERGFLTTDKSCCVDGNIYACGDVTCHPNLVNISELEARMAARAMFDQATLPLNYRNMSAIMFFNPTVATLGLSEQQCQEQGIPHRVAYMTNEIMSHPIAMRSTQGFIKIMVTDDTEMKILGMRAAGPQVSNIVMAIATLMDHDKGAEDVLKSVYPHPSISEITQECLRLLIGRSIYKAEAFPKIMRLSRWSPDQQ